MNLKNNFESKHNVEKLRIFDLVLTSLILFLLIRRASTIKTQNIHMQRENIRKIPQNLRLASHDVRSKYFNLIFYAFFRDLVRFQRILRDQFIRKESSLFYHHHLLRISCLWPRISS